MRVSSRVVSGAGLLLLAGLVTADVLSGSSVIPLGFFGLPPMAAAIAAGPSVTALVAAASLLVSVVIVTTIGSEPASSPSALILVAVLGGIAVLAAQARVTRERNLRQAQHVAEIAQRAIIRSLPSAIGPVLLASRYVSATKEAQIGGDLFEVSPTPAGLRVIIGDVRGKGLAAVHLAADVLSTFRVWAPLEPDATALLRRLDRAVAERAGDEEFVTAAVVDVSSDGTLTVTNSGHHPPLLVSAAADDRFRLLASALPAPPLGLQDLGPSPVSDRYTWHVGDRLLMYTDGLVEAPGPTGHEYPPDRWAPLLRLESLETCLDELVDSVYTHTQDRLDDDLALVLMQHQAPPA